MWIIFVGVCSARGFRKMLSMWDPHIQSNLNPNFPYLLLACTIT